MRIRRLGYFASYSLAFGLTVSSSLQATAQIVSTSFQNGSNGYNGTFDRQISERVAIPDNNDEVNGSTVASYFLDGFSTGGSPDRQNLIRFDSIIGNGAGQIPANATVLDARLAVTTSFSGNAQTNGPYGVSGLLQPFDSSTSYFDFTSSTDYGSRGAWWQDGSATRPVGGYGFQLPGITDRANVTSIVQSWANGAPNHGLVMQAGLSDTVTESANTSDGWSIRTTGFPNGDTRPKLEVSYTTNPIEINTFQRGLNGYTGDRMAVVDSGPNALTEDTGAPVDPNRDPEQTTDGLTLDQVFLDGVFFSDPTGANSSPDKFGLFQFGSVFGNGAGQAPQDVPVAKAFAVITTGDQDGTARTSGPWSAYTMNRVWDDTTLHSSSAFGSVDGLQVGEGDISLLDTLDGFIRGSEVWFDVTDYLEGVRNGATDNGFAIRADGTADGWQIHANGSSVADARPRLVVYSGDLGITSLAGDFNDDGSVNGTDFLQWQQGFPGQFSANDLSDWQSNYGQGPGGPLLNAVPEPGSVILLGLSLLGGMAIRPRHRS